jgi:hypothetical protein
MDYQESSSSFYQDEPAEQLTIYRETRDEEVSANHGPRGDCRLHEGCDEHDQFSIQAACTESSMGSDYDREDTSYIQVIPRAAEDASTKRSFLCRSLAWSQDSLDDRVVKKYRREESSPTSHGESLHGFSFEPPHHRRQGSTESLHWEEKVVDPLDLINFVQSKGIAEF